MVMKGRRITFEWQDWTSDCYWMVSSTNSPVIILDECFNDVLVEV